MMKALKHISGILFAAIGVMFFVGAVGDMINPESERPLWMDIMLLTVLGLLPLGGAVVLLKRKAADRTATCCPECGNAEHSPAGVLVSAHNPWMFYLGGWLLASLWGASRERQVRCVDCDALYFTETRGSRIAGIILWVIFLLVLMGTIASSLEE